MVSSRSFIFAYFMRLIPFSVTLGGAVLFVLFGFIYLYEAFSMTPEMDLPLSLLPEH